tara:strand:+ start:379 stop:1512 length:1134 start_codon:yes stop_codon:yes gene_type:complete
MSGSTVSFKTLAAVLPHVVLHGLDEKGNPKAGHPVLIRGRHGIGKSATVYQLAERLGLPVVERRASQMSEGDLLGMPKGEPTTVNGKLASAFVPFAWFIKAMTQPVVLFLDEVDRATQEVRQGIFELCDSRKLAGHVLHSGTIIVAAVNGGLHGAAYAVAVMDPAELDRYTTFDVEPTTEDWLDWAKGNVSPIVWDFINNNHAHLEHTDEIEDGKVYPSRRSWDRLNTTLSHAGLLEKDADLNILFELANAYVGFEAAVSFRDFVKNYKFQVTVEDLLDGGTSGLEKVSKWGINEHAAMIEKMKTQEVFKTPLNNEQVLNLADYFLLIPSEVAMKLWAVLGTQDTEQNDNVRQLHGATGRSGEKVVGRLIELLASES